MPDTLEIPVTGKVSITATQAAKDYQDFVRYYNAFIERKYQLSLQPKTTK